MRIFPLALALLAVLAAPAAAARPLSTGFFDAATPERLDDAATLGADLFRVGVGWSSVAASEPVNPRDPADPAYDWSSVDTAVAAAGARGLRVLLSIDGAPRWAQGRGRPRSLDPSSAWKPSARAAGAFAEALARRHPDVGYVQLLNEPNLDKYLAPQWRRGKPFAPVRYRKLLNAAYAGLRRAGSGAKLVTAGTAPYGDPGRGGHRIMPVRFWRIVFRKTVRFDVLAHHPYAIDGPRRRALNRNDVAIPDMGKLTRLTRAAVRRHKLLPNRSKRFWVTEMSWDSSPPDPYGVPATRHARWLADAFFVLWKQGVDTVLWYQTRDQAPVPSYAATNQSGVLLRDGRPKPAARAFAFPFSCERRGRRTRVWAKAPAAGTVRIVRGGHTVRRLRAGSNGIVSGSVRGHGTFRARSDATTSISCRS